MSKTTILDKEIAMYQIKVNGVLMPTIYYSLHEAIAAVEHEKSRGCAVMCDIIPLDSKSN